MHSSKPNRVITAENQSQFAPDPILGSFLNHSSSLEGFVAQDFWISMEFGRERSTDPKFFEDSGMKTAVSNFEKFCAKSTQHRIKDYSHPPSNPTIPPIIHFIWLGSPLTNKIKGILATWIHCHPGWEIWVWEDADIEQFPWTNGFSKLAFNAAKSWAEKADILRYDILYLYGGIYTDIDSVCLKSFNDLINNGVTLFAGQETNRIGSREDTTLYIANGLVGAAKGSSIIKFCIDHLRMEDEAPSEALMYRTGPVLFTRACLEGLTTSGQENILILPCSYFYPLPYFSNLAHKRMNLEEIASLYITEESMAVHLWEESWKDNAKP